MKNSIRSCFITLFFLSLSLFGMSARFGLSPDNSNELLLSLINSAKSKIQINIYEFDNEVIKNALINKIRNNITVQLLIDGQPYGKVSKKEVSILNEIENAIRSNQVQNDYIIIMRANDLKLRRFRFNHAKYIIIDSNQVFVSSENFSISAHPDKGKVGNRGWHVILENETIAKKFEAMFEKDSGLPLIQGKLQQLDVEIMNNGNIPFELKEEEKEKILLDRTIPSLNLKTGIVNGANLITAPNAREALLSLIRSATKTLDIEQMSLPSSWFVPSLNPKPIFEDNPLIIESIHAAKRGVKVRLLLNDELVFADSNQPNQKNKNLETAINLKRAAVCEKLPIEAKIINIKNVGITYLHNKGIIVDGETVLVSSINGTQNAVMNNREVGLSLHSIDAAKYFGEAFEFDWNASPLLDVKIKCNN